MLENEQRNRITQHEAACRALCLAAVVARWEFEEYLLDTASPPKRERIAQLAADLSDWLEGDGLAPHLSQREKALFAKPLGSWSRQERVDASWRIESLGVMLWALSVVEALPPYDLQFPNEELLDATGVYTFEPASDFTGRCRLRPVSEVQDARDAAELWHWRARAKEMQAGEPPPGRTWAQTISSAARTAHARGWAPAPVRGDFPAFDRPYSELTEEEYSQVRSIAGQRHRALNWLCGHADDWDAVPTDT